MNPGDQNLMAGLGTRAVWAGEQGERWASATQVPVETVAGPPATTSHVESTAEERAAAGIPEALIRHSVGIEDLQDLIADLRQGLDSC